MSANQRTEDETGSGGASGAEALGGAKREVAHESADGDVSPQTETSTDSWAQRHPWLLALITGIAVTTLTGSFAGWREKQSPKPVGVSGTIGSFRFTLSDFSCASAPIPLSDQRGGSVQNCEAKFTVRNNGRRAGSPQVEPTVFVGDEAYEAGSTALFGEVFPNRSVQRSAVFVIPAELSPTRLILVPTFESFIDTFVPFYNEWIVYDLVSPPR